MPGIHDTQAQFSRSDGEGLETQLGEDSGCFGERDTEEQIIGREAGIKNLILEPGIPGCVTLCEFHFLSGPFFPPGLVHSPADAKVGSREVPLGLS